MEEAASVYRVVEDFFSESAGELSVFRGDIVQLVKPIDRHWSYIYFNGNFGKIPTKILGFVKVLVNWVEVKEIFAALNDFRKVEYGDLEFRTGDIILGLNQIDDNWWEGQSYESRGVGIFPVTHVWKLNKQYLIAASQETEKIGVVTTDLEAKLDNELNLRKGDRVRIFRSVDKHYYEGECNGMRGIFPKRFVNLEDEETERDSHLVAASAPSPSPNVSAEDGALDIPPSYEEVLQFGYCNSNTEFDVKSYGRALFPFTAEYPNELTFAEGDIIHLIRYVDSEWIEGELNDKVGVFPKSFIEVIVDCDAKPSDYAEQVAEEYPPGATAIVLHDFIAEMQGDLSVKSGEVVTLLRKLSDDWVEATDATGNCGVCPLNRLQPLEDETQLPTIPETSAVEPSGNLINFSPDESSTEAQPTQRAPDDQVQSSPKVLDAPLRPAPRLPSDSYRKTCESPVRPAPPVPSKKSLPSRNGHAPVAPAPATASAVAPATPESHVGDHVSDPNLTKAEERRKKTREVRSVTLMEMLQSERDYLRDLKICHNTFTKNDKIVQQLRNCGIAVSTLFGNLEEVIDVSEELIRQLEESTQCRKFENQMIGKCFINTAERMSHAYGEYCRNHEEVNDQWTKLESNPELKIVFQKGLEIIRKETNCFDIPALLIKPVQRILKYPLLLNDLIKCTEEDHPDREDLAKATNIILDMAAEINEFKRRKDLVFKYRKEETSSFSSKISKFNMHTMKKKSARLGQRLSSTFGLSTVTKDQEFDAEVHKWKVLEKTIRLFYSDLQQYLDHLKELVSGHFQLGEDIAQFYNERSKQIEIDDLRRVQRAIMSDYYEEMRKLVEENVADILRQLLQKFQGPRKLIDKRNDKLVDYDAATKKLESNKDAARQKFLKDEQVNAKNNYDALNKQLIDELPKFTSYALDIFRNCIVAVIKARKLFTGRVVKETLPLLELPLIAGSPVNCMQDITETFQVKHNIVIDQMLLDFPLVPRHIFPGSGVSVSSLDRRQSTRLSKIRVGSSPDTQSSSNSASKAYSPQSPSQKLYLRNIYGQVYVVIMDYQPIDVLDLCVKRGDVVGVIKKKDPSGNVHKWFVDNGNSRGFLPSKILQQPQEASPSATVHSNNVSPVSAFSSSRTHAANSSLRRATSVDSANKSVMHPNFSAKSPTSANPIVKYPAPPPPVPPRTESCRASSEHRYESVPENDVNYANSELINFESSPKRSSLGDSSLDFLDPFSSDLNQTPSPNHRYEVVPEERYEEVPSEPLGYYYALYPFMSTGPNQLPLGFGQVVLVKQKHDLLGNMEWWLVEDRHGNSGYVPSNYVAPYSK